ncbi:uncharacterized protein VTP21DRAFT_10154 [Calcarisporiella thermophila]|uniref:uncharacterized protein n=1 Tax=Calcarisporiella thermophila TaxID=911321 RepID=UPI0037440FEC
MQTRKYIFVLTLLVLLVVLPSLYYLSYSQDDDDDVFLHSMILASPPIDESVRDGGVIMTELTNSTIRAELGRSTWRLLHTMTARFPTSPTQDEKDALKHFIYLLSRLYPCGQCAHEFQQILKRYPPQVSSREAASQWACAVHNIVNKRLGKEEFDCGQIADKYKCGCEGEENKAKLNARSFSHSIL